ncbi:MAG: transcription elongation factor GreA [Clostridiales bacterium]|jgi:transcription elongation factor GreA|nr:transcription elongation factor GreA [Clostridiales bacterium]
MADEVILTSDGKKALEERLEHLKVTVRREVSDKIKVAREFGDISENAEYDAAKEEQAMIEGEIMEIENKLHKARILDDKVDTAVVSAGNTVRILDLETNTEGDYKIVGTAEADYANKRLSNESPVGKALIGRRKNETVEVFAPKGNFKVKILKIS